MVNPTTTAVFIDQTTIHGVREFAQADGVKKTVWGLILVSAVGFFGFNMYLLASDCIDEKTVASTSRLEPDRFPPLVYCPIGWIDPSKASAFGLEDRHFKHIHGYLLDAQWTMERWLFDGESNVTARGELLQVVRLYFNSSLDDLAYGLSYDVQDVITSNQAFPAISVERHMSIYGMCYVVRQTVRHNPMSYKREMRLLISALYTGAELLEYMLNSRTIKNMFAVGEPTIELTATTELGRGKCSNIFLSWNSFKDIPLRRMACETERVDRTLCMSNCFNSKFVEMGWCEFYAPHGVPKDPERYCTWTYGNHSFDTLSKMYEEDDHMIIEVFDAMHRCKEVCPKPCTYKIYDLSMTEGDLMSDNVTLVTLRHQTTIIERVESLTCGWVSLVANIGGILGLVCGASLLSFAHLVAFLCSSRIRKFTANSTNGAAGKLRNRKRERRTRHSPNNKYYS